MKITLISFTGETLYKWRDSEVIEYNDRKILIHYIGWNSKFDDWIGIILLCIIIIIIIILIIICRFGN
jgi:hypothetical protein